MGVPFIGPRPGTEQDSEMKGTSSLDWVLAAAKAENKALALSQCK